MITRALGIGLGFLADRVFGDPAKHHPVAWFGSYAAALEEPLYRDSVPAGVRYVAACTGPVAAAGLVAERCSRRHPAAHIAVTAIATWAALGTQRLAHEGHQMADRLAADDLGAARAQLPNLCGRDADQLDAPELARATVESMAENTADAGVATLFWAAVAGVPGILTHRAVNTLDAMVGHRNQRYGRFGTAAARLDDALDWVPARITGALACALAPTVGGSAREAWRIMRRDATNHPSPNGGWCESAWAGALGVQLGGTNVYASRVEERGLLGDGPRPNGPQVRRAALLVGRVSAAATALAMAAQLFSRRRR